MLLTQKLVLHSGYQAGVEGQKDHKLGHSCARVTKGKFSESWVKDYIVHLGSYI